MRERVRTEEGIAVNMWTLETSDETLPLPARGERAGVRGNPRSLLHSFTETGGFKK
jgi:hypothetical protein